MFARWPVCAVLVMGLMGQAAAAHASEVTYAFNIPAEALTATLRTIGQETTINIVFAPDTVGDAQAPAIQGELTAEQAVLRALSRTKLRARKATANSILIEPLPAASNIARQALRHGENAPVVDDPPGDQVVANGSSASVEPLATMNSADQPLKEVVVTAQKKVERLMDVPVPVTVLDADGLSENDQNRLQDYFAQIPGLSLANNGGSGGAQNLAIRGVTTGVVSNPTVGIMIDDVPYGSSTGMGSGNMLVPDIDPSDLERIEVLKGPQGTLYGADSMGGLVKFVTRDPTTDAASGRVEVLGDYVDQGELGYGVRGAANVPLTDDLAVRASTFARRDPGYVNNVLTDRDNVNRVDAYGGRVSALWRPSDAFSLKLGALLQNTDGDGTQAVDATLDVNGNLHPLYGYQQQARLRGTENYDLEVRLYTATLNAKLAGLDFISITGYGENKYLDVQDYSQLYGEPSEGRYFAETEKVTQEFRLSNQGRILDWLAGAFFTHENSPADLPSDTVDPTTGAQTGLLIDFNYPSTVTEYALFGDLTFHVTDRFDLQVGGRESENRQVYNETDTGPFVPAYFGFPSPFVEATERASGNAFTYLFTPEFRISPALMVYARVTSGYRLGGNNVNAVVYHLPTEFKPDRTTNEELGVKGSFFNGALTLDASAYYIDWKQIQITLKSPTGRYNANGGDAKSQGVEVSMQTHPAKGLTIGANASVNDARLTQNLPPTASAFGVSGERLPYSVPFSGSVSLDQDWPLAGDWAGFIGATVSYVGGREGEFALSPAAARLHFAAYADTSLRAGVSGDSWTINLFANNVANTRGIVGGGENYGESAYNIIYVQPRTIGLSLTKKF